MLHSKISLLIRVLILSLLGLIGVLILSLLGLAVYTRILQAQWKAPANTHLISTVAINCGSSSNSTALDGREWMGESSPEMDFISGESRSSVYVQTSSSGITVDPVPYKTSRISATEFRYTFPVIPGQKIVRLHFYPASYRGFENWIDYFSVKAGPFVLLRNYSVSLAAQTSGVNYIVKEFFLNIEERNQELMITFSPSVIDKLKKQKTYTFVNGIEIISMPTGLYYTPEQELGARIVGLSDGSYFIDNGTALEVIHRFNVGGITVKSMEDFGLFRQWDEDINFLTEPKGRQVTHGALKHKNIPASVAPLKIYRTSWKVETNLYNMYYHLTWKIPVDLGFGYLVRLHLCELDYRMAGRTLREFSVLINNQIAEKWADVIRWSNEVGIPMYKDYIVILEEGSESHITVRLESDDELVFGLLNGMEIFRLSNLENNLATSNIIYPTGLLTSPNQKNVKFSNANIIGTALTVVIIVLSIVAYCLRTYCEMHYPDIKGAESASVELCCRCFSLAEIKLATQKFSDEFLIGRGGFGKVYKGVIPGVPGSVAIKRLCLFSRQGAKEFWAEIETLSKLRHINLVSLIGYCNEYEEMILVYEYIPGGTIADNLYKFARKGKDCVPLSWEQRLRICIGAARGLEYLHTSGEYGVIHRDIKDTNILLEKNFIAKISDFGLSKLEKVSPFDSCASSKVKGTFGYLDPNYITTHRLTRKSDVYSFGVVMLVILSGKPAVQVRNAGEPVSLLSSFQQCMALGDATQIVDPSLQGEISSNSLKRFLKIVESCLQLLPKNRPTMAKVVSSLEHAMDQHMNSLDSNIEAPRLTHHETNIQEGIGVASPAEVISEKEIDNHASTSGEGNTHETKILEGIGISPPADVNSEKEIENLASTSRAENSHENKIMVGIPPSTKVNSEKPTENLASTSRGENLLPKERDATGVLKSLFNWTWIVGNGKENVVREPANLNTSSPLAGNSNDGGPGTNGVCTSGSVRSGEQRAEDPRCGVPQKIISIDVASLSFDELKRLTGNFGKNAFIGDGSFGQAYLATLSNGQKVAIKKNCERFYPEKIKYQEGSEPDSDFAAKLLTLSRLKHEHLIQLLGYWIEGNDKILAFEYATMGSLHDVLHGTRGVQGSVLNWNQRVTIAYGAAKGLEHLHEKIDPPIVHGRVSSRNILLFDDFVPKIADFNLGTEPLDWDRSRPGFLVDSLELYYGRSEKFATKSVDIKNFGVVLLELLTGRKPIEYNRPGGEQMLVDWAKPRLDERKVKQCVDPKLNNDYPPKGAAKMAAIASRCLAEYARPNISIVATDLQSLLKLSQH